MPTGSERPVEVPSLGEVPWRYVAWSLKVPRLVSPRYKSPTRYGDGFPLGHRYHRLRHVVPTHAQRSDVINNINTCAHAQPFSACCCCLCMHQRCKAVFDTAGCTFTCARSRLLLRVFAPSFFSQLPCLPQPCALLCAGAAHTCFLFSKRWLTTRAQQPAFCEPCSLIRSAHTGACCRSFSVQRCLLASRELPIPVESGSLSSALCPVHVLAPGNKRCMCPPNAFIVVGLSQHGVHRSGHVSCEAMLHSSSCSPDVFCASLVGLRFDGRLSCAHGHDCNLTCIISFLRKQTHVTSRKAASRSCPVC